MGDNDYFRKLLNTRVKALYTDDGKTKAVTGILQEVNANYIIVNDVVIGLGINFISCIPKEENNDFKN